MSAVVDAYLARLDVDAGEGPTYDVLRSLHAAHAERVPYENLGIMLGRPPSTDPAACLERLATTGRAGYCFHQNGALELVLRSLGYDVRRRHGHVWTDPADRGGAALNHLVLEVTGLPTDDNPGGRWWPDLGLGEGFLEPLPLVVDTYVDGPLVFAITEVRDDGWSMTNDPTGSFAGCEATPRPAGTDDVSAAHAVLSTPPDGAFTRRIVVQRRTPSTQETVRGCVAITIDAGGRHEHELTTYDDWRAALDAVGLPLDDVDADDLRALFDRQLASHLAHRDTL